MRRAGPPLPVGPCPRLTMNLEGLEMVAVLVVLALFVKVLEQFGLFEPVSLEGNPGVWACLVCWLEGQWPAGLGRGAAGVSRLVMGWASGGEEEGVWGAARASGTGKERETRGVGLGETRRESGALGV